MGVGLLDMYFPSVIGIPKKDLDRLVEHLDGYYREWSKEKLDKVKER